YYAPTSFGWRDLLIHNSAFTKVETAPGGATHIDFTDDYKKTMSWSNHTGAALVAIWIWLFFLLVVGFGYSYFWTAATIIYFLMRRHVDDTDVSEVYFEEGDLEPPPSGVAAPAAPAPKPNTVSLNLVETPTVPVASAAPMPP